MERFARMVICLVNTMLNNINKEKMNRLVDEEGVPV